MLTKNTIDEHNTLVRLAQNIVPFLMEVENFNEDGTINWQNISIELIKKHGTGFTGDDFKSAIQFIECSLHHNTTLDQLLIPSYTQIH